MVKIFLDDYRIPEDCVSYMHKRIGKENPIYLEDWVVVKNYDEFVREVVKNFPNISHISFDHDLADEHYTPQEYWDNYEESAEYQLNQNYKEKTGYEAAVWLKDYYKFYNFNHPLPTLYVHSMNPVGTDNIINLFK